MPAVSLRLSVGCFLLPARLGLRIILVKYEHLDGSVTNLLRGVGLIPHKVREELRLFEEIVEPLCGCRHAWSLLDCRGARPARVGRVRVLPLHFIFYLDLKLRLTVRSFLLHLIITFSQ